MATPNQIQGGRWDDYLRSKYSLKGGPVSSEIASEIVPVTVIPFDLEDYFLLGDKLLGGRADQVAVATEFSQISLNNKAGSGHLVIFEGFYQRNLAVLTDLSVIRGVVFSGVDIFQFARDGRINIGSADLGASFVRRGSSVFHQGVKHIEFESSPSDVFIKVPIILAPGDSILMETDLVNQAIQVTFFWRETLLEPSAVG